MGDMAEREREAELDAEVRPKKRKKKAAPEPEPAPLTEEERNDLVKDRVREIEAREQEYIQGLSKMAPKLEYITLNRRPGAPDKKKIRPDVAGIIETIFLVDVKKTYRRLRKKMSLGMRRSEHAFVHRAVDEAPGDAFNAFRLYITAKREQERWELENEMVHAAMWNAANRVLQAEKDQGFRSKQITDADVKAMAALLFPDEWTAQQLRRKEFELMVAGVQDFATKYGKRMDGVNTMLAKLRG